MKKWIVIGLALLLVLTGGFVVSRRPRSVTPSAAPGPDAVAVEVATVQRGTIERVLELNGSVVSTQRVELTTEIPGKIDVIAVREGARVAAEQLIVRLDTAQLAAQVAQARNAVAEAEANLKNTEANLVRMQQLHKDGAVSKQQLDAGVLQRDVARAHLDAAQAALQLVSVQLDNSSVRAPFAGRIAEVPVAIGEYVVPGTKIAVLYDDRALEVEVHVGERDLALVRANQPVVVRSDAAPGATIAGTVRVIIPAADPASRAATVRIRLADPPPAVLPGISAVAQIVVERREQVLVVPSQALRRNGADEVVVVKDGRADVRQVLVGLRHSHLVQITYGLAEGETVVTLGPETLTDGQPVKVVSR